MTSIVDLNQLSAYGLSARALDNYFRQIGRPLAAFPQSFFNVLNFPPKNYTGFPNAWPEKGYTIYPPQPPGSPAVPPIIIIPSSGLDWSASLGPQAVSNVENFLNKDAITLKYFWQWIKEGDAASNQMSINTPIQYDTAVDGFNYVNNTSPQINNYLPALLKTSNQIDLTNLTSVGWRNGTSTGMTPTVDSTDVQLLNGTTVDTNATPQPIPTPSGTSPVYQTGLTGVVTSGATQTIYVGGQITSSMTTSNTQGSTTSSTTGGDSAWSVSGTIAYTAPIGGPSLSATASKSYDSSWSKVKTIDFSQTSETTTSVTNQVGYSITINPDAVSTNSQTVGSTDSVGSPPQ